MHAFGPIGSACGIHTGDSKGDTAVEQRRGMVTNSLSRHTAGRGLPENGGIHWVELEYSGGMGGHETNYGNNNIKLINSYSTLKWHKGL